MPAASPASGILPRLTRLLVPVAGGIAVFFCAAFIIRADELRDFLR
jgi:hypothetical protein